MNIKYGKTAIVLDNNDNYVEFVVMCREDGSEAFEPYRYTLQPGEHLLFDAPMPPSTMCIKHWNGEDWEENAAGQQLEEWNRAQLQDAPQPGIPLEQRMEAMENAILEIALGRAPKADFIQSMYMQGKVSDTQLQLFREQNAITAEEIGQIASI